MSPTIQLSLYDLTPLAQPIHVPTISDKHPWEMSEEEYEVYEDTILYHNRPSVSGRDNPFQEFLTGQEAGVFLALRAGETVPPEVLARFEELKEWHETGSCSPAGEVPAFPGLKMIGGPTSTCGLPALMTCIP